MIPYDPIISVLPQESAKFGLSFLYFSSKFLPTSPAQPHHGPRKATRPLRRRGRRGEQQTAREGRPRRLGRAEGLAGAGALAAEDAQVVAAEGHDGTDHLLEQLGKGYKKKLEMLEKHRN